MERRGGGWHFDPALEMLLPLPGIPCRDSGKRWWSLTCFVEADRNLYSTALNIRFSLCSSILEMGFLNVSCIRKYFYGSQQKRIKLRLH